MLATLPQDIPLREHSHLDLQHTSHPNTLTLDDRLCPGCKKSAVNEQGGLVVAFGQSFFHVDCFKCAKCRNQVTADTNLLLLSDGSPICANCSYSCNICHLPILDEAIMTGDDSYHAHCFKCKVCANRIDELVFAKTSQGIYCMNCHNERMIKIRKHAQKKAEREKAQGGSASKSREHDGKNQLHYNESLAGEGQSRSGLAQLQMSPSSSIRTPSGTLRAPQKTVRGPDAFEVLPPSYSHAAVGRPPDTTHLSPSTSFPSQSLSVTATPPPERHNRGNFAKPTIEPYSNSVGHQLSRYNAHPIPLASPSLDSDKKSAYDDGVRRLDVFREQQSILPNVGSLPSEALQSNVPTEGLFATSGLDKCSSINPDLPLSVPKAIPSSASSSHFPRLGSLELQSLNHSTIPPHLTADYSFKERTSSRPPSRNDSIYSNPSAAGLMQNGRHSSHSRPSSIQANVDDTVVMASPTSVTLDLDTSKTLTSVKSLPVHGGVQGQRSSATLSPTDVNGCNVRKRFSSTSNISLEGCRSANTSRSASPAYRADVPHSVESETDTEPENELERLHTKRNIIPPAPPPKDSKGKRPIAFDTEADLDTSEMSQFGDVSEDLLESLRVERMSHSTFIAPALPPIRFSLNTTDFSELLGSVGGIMSLKSMDDVAMLTRQKQDDNALSTPPYLVPTPTLDTSGENVALPPSEISNSQATRLDDASPAVLSSSQMHDDESSSSSDPRIYSDQTQITITEPESTIAVSLGRSTSDLIYKRLQETSNSAKKTGAQHLHVDVSLVDAIIELIESQKAEYHNLTGKVEGMNRESKQYVDGLTVAQTEYDRELKARRDAEAEVTRLRVLLSGQAARLTVLSEDHRRQELRQQLSKELNENLSGLEHDLSRLKVERDMTLAEVEELSANKSSTANPPDMAANNLGRSLTKRLDTIRSQYQRELIPLTEQKEALSREIAELKTVRDAFLEETTVLNARNEELAQLSTVYTRRFENTTELPARVLQDSFRHSSDNTRSQLQHPNLIAPSLSSSTSGSSAIYDENSDSRFIKTSKSDELHTPAKAKFKWPGTKAKELVSPAFNGEPNKGKAHFEHNFQQLSILRFTRCDHCSDKMWGSQLRCTVCSISVHVRCIANVQIPCAQHQNALGDEALPISLPPSIFGRDLTEQVRADSKDEERQVPVIVEKCIEAVEARALDYEGIYRKTGGSSQSKSITQMFERGDYASFDLCDADKFNDICSVTSVLKTYFRSLPVPLLTFDLHDQFMAAVAIRDPSFKNKSLTDLVNRLPDEHYFTLRMLMLHLNHVGDHCEHNLMNSRNMGVVFGPTLMRSRDPGAEFNDMAGKALCVEWLVDNAPQVFNIKI